MTGIDLLWNTLEYLVNQINRITQVASVTLKDP